MYDAIEGLFLMKQVMIDLMKYSSRQIKWGGSIVVLMVPIGHLSRFKNRMDLFASAELLKNGGA